jgi:hypothetical protein
MENYSLRGHLLSGTNCSDEDVLLIGQDDHSMCLDTSVWDLGTIDSSRMSAHEDTTTHTRYSMIQREIVVNDDVQSHIGEPSSIIDSGKFNTLSSIESVVGDSIVSTRSERHDVAPQHDCDQESHHLAGQLRVS